MFMTFSEAIKTCLVDKYATFSGRATRSEYWYVVLFGYLLALLIVLLGMMVDSPELIIGLSSVLSLILLVPGLAVCIRRHRKKWLVVSIGINTLYRCLCIIDYFLLKE